MTKFVGVLLTITVTGFSFCASAQQSSFVPYTIDEKNHQALLNYLGEQPAKFSMPLINSLNQLEMAAQSKKVADTKKPPDKK